MTMHTIILLFACVLYASAIPEPDPNYYPSNLPTIIRPTYRPNHAPTIVRPTYNPIQKPTFIRVRRFTDGSRRFDGQNPQQEKRPEWEIKPDLSRDQRGNTNGQVTIQKHGENHDFEAGWGQTIRGPDKHSETWHAGGSIRW